MKSKFIAKINIRHSFENPGETPEVRKKTFLSFEEAKKFIINIINNIQLYNLSEKNQIPEYYWTEAAEINGRKMKNLSLETAFNQNMHKEELRKTKVYKELLESKNTIMVEIT